MFSKTILIGFNRNLIRPFRLHQYAANSTRLGQKSTVSLVRKFSSKDVNDGDERSSNELIKESTVRSNEKSDERSMDGYDSDNDLSKIGLPPETKDKVSIYDTNETVEEARMRLIRESEVIDFDQNAIYMYPAGLNYSMKSDRIFDLECKHIEPYRDFGSISLIQSNVLIIGSGLLGTSIAFWLKDIGSKALDVNVIDRDFKNLHSNTGLTASGIQQQFTTHECVELAQHSADFLRTTRRHLNLINKEPPDIDYCPTGNLILADENGVDLMENSFRVQTELGQKTVRLDPDTLKAKYPWLNTNGVKLATLGLENEGHFNSQPLLKSLRMKAEHLEARFWQCEFVDFNLHLISVTDQTNNILKLERCRHAMVRDMGGDLFMISFDQVVICAGAENYKFGPLLGLGDPTHPEVCMHLPVPLKKRKRYYYAFECNLGPGIDFPLLIDPSGVYCRPDNFAGRYIAGKMPSEDEEIDNNNSDVDYKYFDNIIRPVLERRVPAFKNLRLLRGWSCFEDVNTFDGLPLIGNHPFYENVTFVGGLGVHAAALAPAVGKAVAELILFDQYRTVDLTRFGWERFFSGYKFEEKESMKF